MNSFGNNSNESSKREKRINDIIRRIPNSNKWALIFDELCNPPSFNESVKIDKSIEKCIKLDEIKINTSFVRKQIKKFDEQSNMLIGNIGGATLDDYFNKYFKNLKNIKSLEKEFMIIMEKMKYLFMGLISLNEYDIIHLDIKPNNIVVSNGYFKLIDFGLSNSINNIKHFINRSYNEYKSPRIYIYYPLEYFYYNLSKDELNTELTKIDEEGIDNFRDHMDIYIEILTFLGYYPKKEILDLLHTYKSINFNISKDKYIDIIKGIDTFSLGMLFPVLFYNTDLFDYINDSNILLEFFNLFKVMCNPDYKQRINIYDAYDTFKKLLNKFSKKKTKKKVSKRKIKSKRKSKN